MHPKKDGREKEIARDPRLQKKIAQLKGVTYTVPLAEVAEDPVESGVVDAFAVQKGCVGSFEEELGQATDILGELMDMNEKVDTFCSSIPCP